MALSSKRKQEVVADMQATAHNSLSLVIAQGQGITAPEMDSLRVLARERSVVLKVAKNTLVRNALGDTEFACINDSLKGPNLFAFSMEEAGAGAKLFKEFAKQNKNFLIKAFSVDGKLMAGSEIDRLAMLPTREEALSRLLATMQAPVTKLAQTLQEIPGSLVRVLDAVRKHREAGN